jgi:hypothetical protein
MARDTRKSQQGYIYLPKDYSIVSWKVEIIDADGTTEDVTDYVLDESSVTRVATDALSNFRFTLDNNSGRFMNRFVAGNIVNIYYDYTSKGSLSTIRFRGYVDGVYDNFDVSNGFFLSIEGRDAPKSATNEHFADTNITIQFSGRNNIDCWAGTAGAVDDEGNFEDGVLYNGGLTLKVYDTVSKSWKIWKDLSSGEKTTIRAQTGYTQTHTNTYIDRSRLNISKSIADEGDYEFRIWYDPSTDKSYLMVHPEEGVVNQSEYVAAPVNFLGISRYGMDTTTEYNRVKEKGKTDNNIVIIRTKGDATRQSELWIKDREETSSTLSTNTEVELKATARVTELKNAPARGNISCLGLPTLQPAEKIQFRIPYVITGQLKVKSFTITFGPSVGLEFSLDIKSRETRFEKIFKDRIDDTVNITPNDNPNGMTNAYMFDFSDPTDYVTSSDYQIVNKILTLSAGITTATITLVDPITTDENIIYAELRIKASQMWNCTYRASNNGGLNWEDVTPGVLHTFSTTGKSLRWEITMLESTTGVSPEFEKLCVLVK